MYDQQQTKLNVKSKKGIGLKKTWGQHERSSSTSEKAHDRTMCLCSNECNSFPVIASHTFLKKDEV